MKAIPPAALSALLLVAIVGSILLLDDGSYPALHPVLCFGICATIQCLATRLARFLKPEWRGWLFVASLVQQLASVLFFYLVWMPGDKGDPATLRTGFDSLRYELFARWLAESGLNFDVLRSLPLEQQGSVVFPALVFYVFGYNPLFAIFGNSLLLLLTAVGLAYLGSAAGKPTIAIVSACLLLVLPESIFYGSVALKETLVAFGVIMAVVGVYLLLFRARLSGLILLISCVYVLGEVRIGSVIIVLCCAVSAAISSWKGPLRVVSRTFILLVVSSLAYWANQQFAFSRVARLETLLVPHQLSILEGFTPTHRMENSIGVMFYSEHLLTRVALIPVRSVFPILMPFPFWKIAGPSSWLTNFSTVLLLLLAPAVAYAAWSHRRRILMWNFLVVPLLAALAVAGNGVITVSERFRYPAVPFFMFCAVLGLASRYKLDRWYAVYGLLLVCAGGLYLIVKAYG